MATLGTELPDLNEVKGTAAQAMTLAPSPMASAFPLPDAVLAIPVSVQVVIGSCRLNLGQVAQLGPGSVVTLDEKLGTPAIILVNGKEVARGELFVLDGEGDRLGLTITSVAGGNRP